MSPRLRFGPLDDAALARHRAAEPTYDHIGSTLTDDGAPGVNRQTERRLVGHGPGAFAAARAALRAWGPQRALGATAEPAGVAPDLGATVVLGLGVGPVRVVVPNRIVAVVDEPDRYAYAYGTLPGHPERGEELFDLRLHPDGRVELTIRTDSEPAGALRHLAPVIRPLQRAAIGRYLAAVADAVER